MGNSGWTNDPTDVLAPSDAGPADPRVYIGDNDPMLAALGQNAGIVWYFGENRAYIMSVQQSGSPDYGQFEFYARLDTVDSLFQILGVDYDVLNDRMFMAVGSGYDPVTRNIEIDFNLPVDIGENLTISDAADIIMGDGFGGGIGQIRDEDGIHYLKGQQGSESVTFAAAILHTRTVTFPTPFAVGDVPNVSVNIASAGGSTRWWNAKADTFTNTDFRLICQTTDAARAAEAWAAVPVTWTATVEG